jgi:hypothetical protein
MIEYHLDAITVTGAPTSVTFQVWRLAGGKIDALESATYTPAQIANPLPIRSEVNSLSTWVTVSFTGGTSPSISGAIFGRPVSDASVPVNNQVAPAVVTALPYFNDAVTTAAQIKATAGQIYALDLLNTTAATAYVQVFFKPAASVTLGTTPPDLTIRLTPNQSKSISYPVAVSLADGTGLSIAATTTPTGAVGAGVSASVAYG